MRLCRGKPWAAHHGLRHARADHDTQVRQLRGHECKAGPDRMVERAIGFAAWSSPGCRPALRTGTCAVGNHGARSPTRAISERPAVATGRKDGTTQSRRATAGVGSRRADERIHDGDRVLASNPARDVEEQLDPARSPCVHVSRGAAPPSSPRFPTRPRCAAPIQPATGQARQREPRRYGTRTMNRAPPRAPDRPTSRLPR